MNTYTTMTLVSHDVEVVNTEPVQWALARLISTVEAAIPVHHCHRMEDADADSLCILVTSYARAPGEALGRVDLPDAPESFVLAPVDIDGRKALVASGADPLGLVYAITELTDRVACAEDPVTALAFDEPITGRPANRIRSIARYFCSDVEDEAWYHDRGFWDRYLSMLVTHRFNRFSMSFGLGYNFPRNLYDTYLYFAYPFLVDVPGYDVRASGLPDDERDRNLESLRYISAETGRRGLQFQLALWTHAYEWVNSPNANYVTEGLTPDTHADYCREALNRILETCPEITGVTLRIHGESGIPEGSYDFWKTVFEGIVRTGREIEIDMHAKGLDQKMIDIALDTGLPVVVSPKYWAEHQALPMHQASIRALEAPRFDRDSDFMSFSGGSRRFVRYSYGDLLREDRRYGVLYRIWAGTQRVLTWGDPAMAAGYGRCASLAGSDGMELCEPLTFKGRMGTGSPGDRAGYGDASLAPGLDDWTKFEQTYRQIGRLLYDPAADPDGWRRALIRDVGPVAADPLERALSNASRILPLVTIAHHPSASNNQYWPEIYTNMPIVNPEGHPYRDTPSPKVFNTVSPLDPATFSSIEEYATCAAEGEADARYAPVEVAAWLDGFAKAAEAALEEARADAADPEAVPFRRLAIDIEIQAGIGRFFAHKLRAGVAYALWERKQETGLLQAAVASYREARQAWADLAERASVYAADQGYGQDAHRRGHWADRLPAIDADLADMVALLEGEAVSTRLPADLDLPGRPVVRAEHSPVDGFAPGDAIEVALTTAEPLSTVRVRYRHLNQAENYETTEAIRSTDGGYVAEIPGAYTDSPYALQYGFEVTDTEGRAGFWPGLDPDLSNQPYFVIRQLRSS